MEISHNKTSLCNEYILLKLFEIYTQKKKEEEMTIAKIH
jgi:hypothetical protein